MVRSSGNWSHWLAIKECLNHQSYLYADRPGEIGFTAGMDAQLGFSQPLYPPGVYQLDGYYRGSNLAHFINNGSLPLTRVNNVATRIMLPYFALGQDKATFPALLNNINVTIEKAAGDIRTAGAASAVLLTNKGILLLTAKTDLTLFDLDCCQQSEPKSGLKRHPSRSWLPAHLVATSTAPPLAPGQQPALRYRTSVRPTMP